MTIARIHKAIVYAAEQLIVPLRVHKAIVYVAEQPSLLPTYLDTMWYRNATEWRRLTPSVNTGLRRQTEGGDRRITEAGDYRYIAEALDPSAWVVAQEVFVYTGGVWRVIYRVGG